MVEGYGEHQKAVYQALQAFADKSPKEAATGLLSALGYSSAKTINLDGSVSTFLRQLDPDERLTREKSEAETGMWQSVDFVFQLTNDELPMLAQGQKDLFGNDASWHRSIIESFVFLAIELEGDIWTRGKLAAITREVNRLFPMPAIIFFRYGDKLTLSLIPRRANKTDSSRDVIEATSKVSLIKDVDLKNPHRAHVSILADLHIHAGVAKKTPSNFADLYQAWTEILSVEELNKKFYKKLSDWYLWSVSQVSWPVAQKAKDQTEKLNQIAVIRMLTRLIFVWFIKEKGLVPDALFNGSQLAKLLKDNPLKNPKASTFYKAILQNLFFATLNTEKNDKRKWRQRSASGGTSDYLVTTKYRYKDDFNDADGALKLFRKVPFLNGGLFECLDRELSEEDRQRNSDLEKLATKEGSQLVIRADGFSERKDNGLKVPNEIFFGREISADLNKAYNTKNKKYAIDGLIHIFESYKFTVEENTPFEEEVALDPELLGKVFENLIASYNADTSTTARKKSGSFYTPRVVVDYMVDEALTGHLASALKPAPLADGLERHKNINEVLDLGTATGELDLPHQQAESKQGTTSGIDARLRGLLDYGDKAHGFGENEIDNLIAAIESIRAIDPACGSGAFLMGLLQKLVHVLEKLDPDNTRWKKRNRQPLEHALEEARNIPDPARKAERVDDAQKALDKLDKDFSNANYPDYARKLYLIDKCIHGVDIQPIAVQIAKLRFFISLVVSQKIDENEKNLNITPLPNLETRIVAANTIRPMERESQQDLFRDETISELEAQLRDANERHFSARTRRTKLKVRKLISDLRHHLSERLRQTHGISEGVARQIARWDPFDQNMAADFFDPEWMYGRADKFNIVIANPPYIRQEKIDKDEKAWLKATHDSLKKSKTKTAKFLPSGLYQSFAGTSDYLVYFMERGLDLLGGDGMFVFITSNKWYRAKYGTNIRTWINRAAHIRSIIDFGDASVFDAIAYPTIITAQKRPRIEEQPKDNDILKAWHWPQELGRDDIPDFPEMFREQAFEVPQKSLDNQKGWQLEPAYKRELLERIRQAGTPLGEYVEGRFYRGILTGFNDAFVITGAKKDQLIAQDPKSADIIKPFLRGKDIKRWRVEPEDLWLIFTRQGIDIDAYPAVKQHLGEFKERLEPKPADWPTGKKWKGRKHGPYHWYEIQDTIAYWREFEKPKIFVPAIQSGVHYAPDTEGFFGNDKTNIIVHSNWKYLLGILNSAVSWWLTRQTFSSKQGGFYEFKPMYVTTVPIPESDTSQTELVEAAVNTIIEGAPDPRFEQLLNGLVYELFFPDDLHARNIHLFDACTRANLDRLAGLEGEALKQVAQTFLQTHMKPGSPIRVMLSDLQSLEVVRIIEAKT